jgi:DNA-binding CsgD family transcriptional regulator
MTKKDITFWLSEMGIILLSGWLRSGCGCGEIARNMGISQQKLKKLLDENKELAKLMDLNQETVDFMVEDALLKKALSGDVRACTHWLKVRTPRWSGEEKKAADKSAVGDVDGEIENLLANPAEDRGVGLE